jgi:hypothetical protein
MAEERPEYKADTQSPAADPAAPPTPAPAVSEAGGAAGDPDAIGTLTARVAELEAQALEKDTALSEAKKTLDARIADIAALKTGNEAAVAAYRKLAVSSNPIFNDEMITGNTIAEIDSSMKKVTGLAEGIKVRLEAALKEIIIPAGAPERSGPDTSGLSPREKIKAGIQNK